MSFAQVEQESLEVAIVMRLSPIAAIARATQNSTALGFVLSFDRLQLALSPPPPPPPPGVIQDFPPLRAVAAHCIFSLSGFSRPDCFFVGK